jgi:hypothetical protein
LAKTVVVKVPHRMSEDDAIERVDRWVRGLVLHYDNQIHEFDAGWERNRLEGRGTAFGQSITGVIEVEPAEVVIRLQLPTLLSLMSSRIEALVQTKAERAFQPA